MPSLPAALVNPPSDINVSKSSKVRATVADESAPALVSDVACELILMACAPARAIAAIKVVLNILVLFLFCLILINLWLDLSFNLGNKVFIRSNNEDFF